MSQGDLERAAIAERPAPPIERQIRPYGERILVRELPPEDTTPSGLVIPETALPRPDRGLILALGEGVRSPQGVLLEIEGLRPGDRVLFIRFGGYTVELPPGAEGESLLLLTPREIVAVERSELEQAAAASIFCEGCGGPLEMCRALAPARCCEACSHPTQAFLAEAETLPPIPRPGRPHW